MLSGKVSHADLYSDHMTKIMEATYLPPVAMSLSEISFYLNIVLLLDVFFMFIGTAWLRTLLPVLLIAGLGVYMISHDSFVKQHHLTGYFANAEKSLPVTGSLWKVAINNEPLIYRIGAETGTKMHLDGVFDMFYGVGNSIHNARVNKSDSNEVFSNIATEVSSG
jgi:hypothetical protein